MIKSSSKRSLFTLFFTMALFAIISIPARAIDNEIQAKFDAAYQKWISYCEAQPINPLSSSITIHVESDEFQQIINLGVAALPCIYEQMKADIDYRHIYGLHIAFHKICKAIPFEGQRGPEGMTMSQVYQTWYRDEYPKTGTKFETLYTIWKSEPAELKFHYPFIQNNSQKTTQKDKQPQNPNEDRIDFYHELSSSVGVSYPLYDIKPDPYPLTTFEKIRRLGIPALPYAFAKLKEGDLDVLPLINYWTDNALEKAIEQNAIPKEKIQAFSLGWWEENKNKWAMPDILAMKKLNPS